MIEPREVLADLPVGLRNELIGCYRAILSNYAEGRWEPAELNGGKFCEVVYSILEGALSGVFPDAASKPRNMLDACRALENQPSIQGRVGDRSLCIQIPRLLPYLYEIRNNRGVGHVGGDVNPNKADAEAVVSTTSWVMAELVRIFHQTSLEQAQKSVDRLVIRRTPLVWETEGVKRVLNPKLAKSDQVLILLYAEGGWVSAQDLQASVEYANKSRFRTNILQALHVQRLIEHDQSAARATITPLGVKSVEDRLLSQR